MSMKPTNINAFILFLVGGLVSAIVKDIYFLVLFCTLILSCFIDKSGYIDDNTSK